MPEVCRWCCFIIIVIALLLDETQIWNHNIMNMVVDDDNGSMTSHVLPHDHVQVNRYLLCHLIEAASHLAAMQLRYLHCTLLQETMVLNPHLIDHSNENFALYGYCVPVFAALSLVANSLVIRTLAFRRPHGEQPPNLSSLDLFLQHLAIYDIAVAGLRRVHFKITKWQKYDFNMPLINMISLKFLSVSAF